MSDRGLCKAVNRAEGMNTINFDTLKAAKSLQDVGFEARQAEAMGVMVTHALSEGLATKNDVRELKAGLAALDVNIDAGLNEVTQKLTIRLGGIVVGAVTLLEVFNRIVPVVPAP